MKKYDYYIGIDPDVKASGYACWNQKDKRLEYYESLQFWAIFHLLRTYRPSETFVIIEAGWLNKSCWHPNKQQGANIACRIGNNVGANHQTGRLFEEMCKYLGLDYQLVKPVKSKMNARTFEQITGIKRTNQDVRDAILLVFNS